MNKFKPSLLTIGLYAAGLSVSSLLLTTPSQAQQSNQTSVNTEQDTENLSKKQRDEQLQKEKEIEAISIKGFRSSVFKSINTKRFSDTVVDAISADDIGGLPDVSIADALIRLPGVTAIRLDGQSSELNIRGLQGGFVFSTLNGREQVSASGGRNVQFDQYPAELIKQAQVYKSQKASLIEGGVAGSVELQTVNALDMSEDSQFRFSAHGNWNDIAEDNADSDSIGHRLTASYQGKYLDDTLGVAIGVARMFQPTVSSRFVNYQFDRKEGLSSIYDGAPDSLLISSGFELNERGGEDTRNAIVTAFNWDPHNDVHLQLDLFYSNFDSGKWDRGLRVSGLNNIVDQQNGLLLTNPIISNGALIGGTFARDPNNVDEAPPHPKSERSMNVQTQADDNSTDTRVFSWGFKGEWDLNEDLFVSFDIAHSEAEETYKDQVLRLARFVDASAETPVIDDNIVMSYQLNGLKPPNVSFNTDFTDINHMMVTSAESYPHIEENSSDAIRLDATYLLDNDHFSAVEFGIRASQRDYELNRGRFLYGTNDYDMRNGQYISYEKEVDAEGNVTYTEAQRFAPYQLTEDMVTVTSIGGDLSYMPNFLSINNEQVLNAWLPADLDRTPIRRWDHSWTMTQNNLVEEEVLAAYVQANLDTELFGIPMTGNFGIRVVNSDQQSTGLIYAGENQGESIADDRGVISKNYIFGTRGISYTDYLPSINLNFSLTEDEQIRFAYAKVMSRANMDKLANSGGFTFNRSDLGNLINFSADTSPELRPFYADQYDISYEHYLPESDGALVVALWHKDIKNFVSDDPTVYKNFDFEAAGYDVPNPPEDLITDENGDLIIWENGDYSIVENVPDAGYIRGFELAYTQTFKFLPGIWSGLGTNLSFSYTDSEITQASQVAGDPNDVAPMRGLSKRVLSATLYYSWDDKFETRVNVRHRSPYLERQIAIGSDQDAYFDEETIWSAQASYYFTENLQGVISMDNLTDEPNISYFGRTTQTGTIQYFGRTLYFGVNYKI